MTCTLTEITCNGSQIFIMCVVGWRHMPFTEGEDTRGCGDTICPPEDEQRAARNMLRIVV